MSQLPPLKLKKDEDRRLRAGHCWIYSNEIDTKATPLQAFAPGDQAELQAHNGKPIGTVYVNPNGLIAARLVSRDGHLLDTSLIVHRLNIALSLRTRLYDRPYYRMVFGESDGLPGLILDRFDDVIVGQITTHGMERVIASVEAALEKVLKPKALLWRNDGGARQLEGLPEYQRLAFGELPEEMFVEENGLRFTCAFSDGQKTGWFYDQRDNRATLARFCRDARMLDVFSYAGAWSLSALNAGAQSATAIDSSERALALANKSAQALGVSERFSVIQADAFDALKAMRGARERFDLVVVDPPAFIKKRRDHREGALAYRRINEMAMQVLKHDGILITCSCSHHFSMNELLDAVNQGARHLDRQVQLLTVLQQSADHPILPAIAETSYLKGAVFRVLPV